MKHPNRLNALREARGISLDRLAAEIGKAKSAVQKYNNGSIDMGTGVLMQIADVLMVQPEDLLTEQAPRIVNRIANVRAAAGLSQEDLAERLNWPLWRVRAIEMATRVPSGDALMQVATALDVGLSALMFDLTTASDQAKAAAALVEGLAEADRQAVFRHADALAQSTETVTRKSGNGA